MTDPIVGIDLGTTNTAVAVCDESGAPRVLADPAGFKVQPSVVSFHPSGNIIIGAEAKQRKIIDPKNTVYSAKRLIGRSFQSKEVSQLAARLPFLTFTHSPRIVPRGCGPAARRGRLGA